MTLTIENVSIDFAAWRQHKKGSRSPVPDKLRRDAMKLTKHYPRSKVVKALKLNSSMLKSWEHSSVKPKPSKDNRSKFFELNTNTTTLTSQKKQITAAFTGTGGQKIELTGEFTMAEISELAKAFLGGSL